MNKLRKLKKAAKPADTAEAPKKASPKKAKPVDLTPRPEPMSDYSASNPAPTLKTPLSIPGPWPNEKYSVFPEWNTGCTVLGLDPSLNGFGICQLNERFQVYKSETWSDLSKLSGRERVAAIVQRVTHLCMNLGSTRKLYVVREDYAYSQSDAADTPLKELGGVLRWIIEGYVPLYTLPIQSVKKFLSGNGNSKKEEMMKEAFKNFGFDGDQNQVDALGVALLGMALLRRDRIQGLTSHQKAVIDSLVSKGHPLTTAT